MRAAAIAILLAACAHDPEVSRVRFLNQPIVWRVSDRTPFAQQPEKRQFNRRYLVFEESVTHPVDRALSLPARIPAKNVNALDEVPDSSWFDNRLLRGLTPAEVRAGPLTESADALRPWKVLSTKSGGRSLGFVVEDTRGQKYVLKFDEPGFPELKSGAGVVSGRLMWALGYQVPADAVATFDAEDLVLAPDAVEKLAMTEVPLDQQRFDELIAKMEHQGDHYRGLISRMLPGAPLGGYSRKGVREDDPNDVIPHEHRRDLRGQWLFFAWIDHTDWKEDNRLDMWVKDEGELGHVEHYLLDFDKTLGAMALTDPREDNGFTYALDPEYALRSLVSFGLWTRPWERIDMPDEPIRRGVGRFESVVFDPELWRPRLPENAFLERDRYDDLWAAKRLMTLTPEQIRAAVKAGEYSDPLSERYLFDMLMARRETLARWAFSRVTPLDRFQVREQDGRFSVCFDDLWIRDGFGDDAQTTYVFRQYGFDGRLFGKTSSMSSADSPSACTQPMTAVRLEDSYTIVRIDVLRSGRAYDPVEVHLARAPEGTMRIIGLNRRR